MEKIKKGDIFVYNDNILVCKGVYKGKTYNKKGNTDNIGLTIKQPKLEDMKVKIWDKVLCNEAEWNDFLKAVEEKGQENEQLKEQLAEKDKEIKKHIDALEYWENNIPNQRQAIRKQVCDEIREFIDNNDHSEENDAKQSSESVIYTKQLYKFLDQIEKGDKK